VTKDLLENRRNGLQNLTLAHKYELKLPKCIGVSIADDVEGWFTAEWIYVAFPWEYNAQMEQALRENNPFRPVQEGTLPLYTFKDPS